MWHKGLEFAGEVIIQKVADSIRDDEPREDRTPEQSEFDRNIKIAKTVLSIVNPPAGRALFLLENGPVIVADAISKIADFVTRKEATEY